MQIYANEFFEKIKNEVPFVKILGFSTKGQKYLNYLKKSKHTIVPKCGRLQQLRMQ